MEGVPVREEVAAFLEGNRRTFMITLRKDGSPTGHPMAGFYGGEVREGGVQPQMDTDEHG